LTFKGPRGVISLRTELFITTAMGTSNPAEYYGTSPGNRNNLISRNGRCETVTTSSRDHGRAYTQQKNMSRHVTSTSAVTSRNNLGIVGSGIFCGYMWRLHLRVETQGSQSRESFRQADRLVRVWNCYETVAPGGDVEDGGDPIVLSRSLTTPS
jgi:hypothetical protein